MKKIISVFLAVALILGVVGAISVIAELHDEVFLIVDRINSFKLSNNKEILGNLSNIQNEIIQFDIDHRVTVATWGQFETLVDFLASEDGIATPNRFNSIIERRTRELAIVPERSFAFYELITDRFAKQYAKNFSFDQLISNERIWAVSPIGSFYENDLRRHERIGGILNDRGVAFIQNPDAIEEMILREINEEIFDIRIVNVAGMTILYLRGENTDFGITLNATDRTMEQSSLEFFVIYPMAEILYRFGISPPRGAVDGVETNFMEHILDYKPTFEAEAEVLQAMGLLHGNERGLDLLRPLTRIEAAAMLVRALGYDNQPFESYSQFDDIAYGSWAVRYANIAAAHGITRGVGVNEYGRDLFAPNAIISADQFATLVLRSSGDVGEFDWETAISMLIERGIITAENADTMDLFTRGDMAKILYEALAAGLL